MKGSACFYCRNCINSRMDTPNAGWAHDCSLGIDNKEINGDEKDASEKCENFDARVGFQVGGYYTHMWFDGGDKEDVDGCLELIMATDGEFPTHDPEDEQIELHICNFKQIERWVEFWGKELRKRGWVSDETNSE